MTLPKDSKRPANTRKGLRPTPDEVSRLMVDWDMLKTPVYQTEIVSDSSGKSDKVKRIEIHPIEWDAKIVFFGGRKTPGIPITITLF